MINKSISTETFKAKGFTLVELLIALFLGLFLIGGAIQIYLSSKQAYEELDRVTYLQENLRYITDTLTREFRHVDTAPTVSWESNSEIEVQREYNCTGGGVTSPPTTYTLRYFVDDGSDILYCNDGGLDQPVISNVQSMTVKRLDAGQDCSSVAASADPVGVCLTFVLNSSGNSPNAYEVNFTVAFRNLVIEDYNAAP